MLDLAFERYIFEINVYSCSSDEFYAKRTKKLNEEIQKIELKGGSMPNKQKMLFTKYFQEKYGQWRYSQVIGVIRLYILGTSIRGETWFVEAKKITRTMKKKSFYHYGKSFEISISNQMPSNEIYNSICLEIKHISSEEPFRNRFIDLEAFNNIGKFVDWREILGF